MESPVERGASVPIAGLLLIATVGVLWVALHLGVQATRLAQAQTAADATALAAVVDGESSASEVARRNGAVVSDLTWVDGGVVAEVQLHGVERVAAASAPRPAARAGIAPALAAAVGTTEEAIGQPIPIVSGRRSRAEQQMLWDNRHQNPYPVAYPGTSRHELGLAIDVPSWFVPILARRGPFTGLCQPLPGVDPVHFELCRRKPSR